MHGHGQGWSNLDFVRAGDTVIYILSVWLFMGPPVTVSNRDGRIPRPGLRDTSHGSDWEIDHYGGT